MRLNITFESATNMAANGIDTSVEPTADLYATFIYLDSSERKRFSQSSHEYLVTVTQVRLYPTHPAIAFFQINDAYTANYHSLHPPPAPHFRSLPAQRPSRRERLPGRRISG